MKVVIIGYGKMGRELENACRKKGIEILTIIDKDDPWPQKVDDDVIALEFTEPTSAVVNLKRCVDLSLPVVCGTTGWYHSLQEVKDYCLKHRGCIVYGSNYSPGVNALFKLTLLAAKIFSSLHRYDVKIEETHHITKKDAPSGTAITMAELLLSSYSELLGWSSIPKEKHLWIESFREEQVIGKHRLSFTSSFDEIVIEHKAQSREGFVCGALDALEWLDQTRPVGFFHFMDIFEKIYAIKI
ncbi:MAG: 4-hydroxy-tetrahydrodipicolinate reductase [Bacteroidales bacterium]|nr:4-hydroxy-tetrahydrodipicolinate reductase [Bacteroidales bacterium]